VSAPVGVLALQGDFAAHAGILRTLGAEVREVRRTRELDGLRGLVVPGGESTTLLKLMEDEAWPAFLRRFARDGKAILGTCAGAILLAREVRPAQSSLGLLDAVVERNAFGRQVDSFETLLSAPALGGPLHGAFIRAPRFREWGPEVEVLARLGDEPVALRQGRVFAATFHPELTGAPGLHRAFLRAAEGAGVRTLRTAS
jgi:5'-phosphate synthase pdxT subunit